MAEITIRIHYTQADGAIEDAGEDYSLSDFAGMLPSIGDRILNPGVPGGLDREDPNSREIWTVVGRFFNPHDLQNYVALIVEARAPSVTERAFCG